MWFIFSRTISIFVSYLHEECRDKNARIYQKNTMKLYFSDKTKENAFQILFETYYSPFCLYAKRFIADTYIRQDIVSEVFATLWDKQNTLDLKSDTVIAYLKMCVRNSCLNYLKHQEYESSYAETVQQRVPLYEREADSVYTLNELYQMLHEALSKLPENYRLVFMKSFFDGMTHAEIAEELQLSVKSVNRYKQKTMELLREELKEFMPIILSILLADFCF